MTTPRRALLAAVVLAASVTAAAGQTNAPSPPAATTQNLAEPNVTEPAAPGHHRTRHRNTHQPLSADQVEQHITRVHDELHITAAQTPQWSVFAQVMRDNAKHIEGLYKGRTQVTGTMNAVDSLKSYEQMAEAHLQDLQKLEPAFEALYNTMDDQQKRAADRMFRNNPGK